MLWGDYECVQDVIVVSNRCNTELHRWAEEEPELEDEVCAPRALCCVL